MLDGCEELAVADELQELGPDREQVLAEAIYAA